MAIAAAAARIDKKDSGLAEPPMAGQRIESDSMGAMELPEEALYGASTQRAVLNFPVSGQRFPRPFLKAIGLLKEAAAMANRRLGLLDPTTADLIRMAAREVVEGKLDDHFPLDVFQTGSGTSTNMNANEVIANRCSHLAGLPLGSKRPAHPNDHVNMGQSSNDVVPSAIHMAAADLLTSSLLPYLRALGSSLEAKAGEFWDVIKVGRTHFMDATPVRLGQEFAGYARQVVLGAERLETALEALLELPLGGTAVGTGLNAHPQFAAMAIAHISEQTGLLFREAMDHFEAQSAKDALVQLHGTLKTVALSLHKIATDVRLLGSGPRCGLGEIQLPAIQPGSSIMPGKVNPVMCEMLLQVCARVIGNDTTVTWAAAGSQFELNTMMPLLAVVTVESLSILANAVRLFDQKCILGLSANAERCRELVDQSMALVTSLVPYIGYDRAAAIAKESVRTGRTIRDLCMAEDILSPELLERALDPKRMTSPDANQTGGS